jgi:transcriptional regulator with XRE-family HTH domain
VKVDPVKLRSLRETKSWSQEHLASAAGLSSRTVQRVESDGSASAETMLALASALGVGPGDLRLTTAAKVPEGLERGVRVGRRSLYIGAGCAVAAIAAGLLLGDLSPKAAGLASAIVGLVVGVSASIQGAVVGWAHKRANTA